ncbi:MAG: L-2-amino-thiazoline-4-carboxylic acid hydrolase [Treponema sp.]|nr:L-2-amino-thiazoline-4-carboxylic acid hydrolase [Treponema sp.]
MDLKTEKTVEKVRAAIKDRAVWLALLYDTFMEALPEAEVERLCRKAIFEFGRMKAKKDPEPFTHRDWVRRHEEKGSALVFESDIEYCEHHSVQRMNFCPLVEAWKEMGLAPERIDTLCDIAMEGDRGRAAAHGVSMELNETIGKGDRFCRLVIRET